MGRKATALTRVGAAGGVLEPAQDDGEDELEDGADCFVCALKDNADDEPARQRFARAMAYGCKVLAKGGGVSTCTDCNNAIAVELDTLARELRTARRDARKR
jgi:hypothetical protein